MIVLHKFKVQGRGHFPIDMLRYDSCFPYSGTDSGEIQSRLERRPAEGVIELGAYHNKNWKPTTGRWDSFLWKVIEHTVL